MPGRNAYAGKPQPQGEPGDDVAPDGRQIAYVSPDSAGKARLWTARLDRRTPPRQMTGLEADDRLCDTNIQPIRFSGEPHLIAAAEASKTPRACHPRCSAPSIPRAFHRDRTG